MLTSKRRTTTSHLLLIAVFSIAAMLPAYYWGVPSGNDQLQHFQFAETIYNSVTSGVVYPSVSADSNHGFGDVGLRFYPPLSYYVLSLLYFLFGDWFFAAQVGFTLAFFVGGVGLYLWAREEFAPETSLLAAALYTFAPYHINLIYNNFLLGEFFAAAVLPFCFLFVTRVCRTGTWASVIGLAVSVALLILTHLPMTIIGSVALVIYGLVLMQRPKIVSTLSKLAVSAGLALLLSSFYWARMLPELEWVKHSSAKYFTDTFSYRNNFLLRPSHFAAASDDVLNLWLADVMLIAILLISIPSLVYLLRRSSGISRFVLAVSIVLITAVFMASPLSDIVWTHVGILQKVQFPWRWMSIVSAFGAMFASIGLFRGFAALKSGNSLPLALGIGAVLIGLVFIDTVIVRGAVYVPRSELRSEFAGIAEASTCECWWPVWAETAALGQKEKVSTPGRTVAVSEWTQTSRRFAVEPGIPERATIATFYYPRWRATINSAEVPVEKDDEGRLAIQLPPERCEVELQFREPSFVSAAYIVSALAWISVAFVLAGLLSKRLKASRLQQDHE
jgi:6-pyruvoyl-tetrahydropterin synthase related domain